MSLLTTKEIYKLQYPSTTLTDTQIDTYIANVSPIIEDYLLRDLETKTRIEWHPSSDDNVLILNEYPVTKVYGVLGNQTNWAEINITNSDAILGITYRQDDALEYYVDMTLDFGEDELTLTVSDYADLQALIDAITTQLDAWSFTYTTNVDSNYASMSLATLLSLKTEQGGENLQIVLWGADKTSQLDYTLEANREIILSNRVRIASNSLMCKYTAGYELPTTTSYGTLPRAIVDVCNRMIKDITSQDAGSGVDLNYQREKLGNAEIANWDYDKAIQGTYIYGLIERYKEQLDRYKKVDISFY